MKNTENIPPKERKRYETFLSHFSLPTFPSSLICFKNIFSFTVFMVQKEKRTTNRLAEYRLLAVVVVFRYLHASFSPIPYDKSILCHLFLAFHLFVAVFCFLVSAFFPFDNETLPKNLQLLVVKALYKKERSKTNFKAFLFFFSVYFIFFSSFCSSSSSSRTTHKRKTVVFKQFAQLDGGKKRKKVGGCKRMLLN